LDPRIPPHDLDIEQSLLGAILIDKEAIVDVSAKLTPDHFYSPAHQAIYESMLQLYENRDPIDILTLGDSLKKVKQLNKIGGSDYLALLAEKVPTAANAIKYGEIIRDLAHKRELIRIGSQIVEKAFDDASTASGLLENTERDIFSLSQKNLSQNFIPLRDALADSFDRLDELHKHAGGLRGVPTGFKDLDDTLAGMQDSNLLILAARPGMGKTAFALNIAQGIAVSEKAPVALFSLEMSKEQLAQRMICAQAMVDAHRLRTGFLKNDDWPRLTQAMAELSEAPIYIDDTPGLSIMDLRAKSRRVKMRHDIKLLIIDYLQLISSPRNANRNEQISEISRGLKTLAKELGVPVISLSQLSREVEKRTDRRPQLADLRESGAIEQDADMVAFIYRDDYYNPESEKVGLAEVIIAKQRNGPLGKIELLFLKEHTKFLTKDNCEMVDGY